ncbi:MAG: SCO family protein [Ferruginibacter sp.]
MKKKWMWYTGFFVALFAFYYVFVYAFTDISQSNLPLINSNVQPFEFTDQNGKTISDKDVEGKVYVTEYFFTTCKGICPRMNTNMRRIYDAFKDEKDFLIISHSCFPETDSVPLLKKYEAKMLLGDLEKNAEGGFTLNTDSSFLNKPLPVNNTWYFVTGNKTDLYSMARHSYMIDNGKSDTTSKIEDQFIHTQFFALLDKQTRVRGIYDGLKEDEIQKLLKDIKALLKEKSQSRSLVQR